MKYPEIDLNDFKIQSAMFKLNTNINSLEEARQHFLKSPVEVRCLYQNVEQLIKLLIVRSTNSVTCERSFNLLRRVKTWLRSSMTQTRLNSIMLCNIHADVINELNIDELMDIFINSNEWRQKWIKN